MHTPIIPALIAAGLQCASLSPLVQSAYAQSRPAPPGEPAFVLTDMVTAVGTVEAINRALREVSLRGDDGRKLVVRVDPTVRNFDQIAVGDRLTIEFLAATAVLIAGHEAASGAAPVAGPASRAAMVAPREKPAGVETETVQVTATIDDIDYAKRRATLRGPEGTPKTVHLDERIGNIERFRKGDTVLIRYTEAVAIAVSK